MITRDYLIRLIEQVADFVARIAGSKREGYFDQGLRTVDEAYDALLDMDRRLFDVADSRTLADLLGPPAKIRAVAAICYEEADLLRLKGDPINAALKYKKSLELVLEAREREPEDDDLEVIQKLCLHVDQETLAPRYRANL